MAIPRLILIRMRNHEDLADPSDNEVNLNDHDRQNHAIMMAYLGSSTYRQVGLAAKPDYTAWVVARAGTGPRARANVLGLGL